MDNVNDLDLIAPEGADRANAALALLETSPDVSANRLSAMERRRAELFAERRQIVRSIKNENRRRRRVMVKARGLATDDLMNLITSRAQAKAKAKASGNAMPKARAVA